MKKVTSGLLALSLLAPVSGVLPLTCPSALAKPSVAVKNLKGRKAPANVPARPASLRGLKSRPQPVSKGGKRTKDATFVVHIDSRVAEAVDVFIDGSYTGTLPGYGDGYYYAYSGPTRIQCVGADGGYWDDTVESYGGTVTRRLR